MSALSIAVRLLLAHQEGRRRRRDCALQKTHLAERNGYFSRLALSRRVLADSLLLNKLPADPQRRFIIAVRNWLPLAAQRALHNHERHETHERIAWKSRGSTPLFHVFRGSKMNLAFMSRQRKGSSLQ